MLDQQMTISEADFRKAIIDAAQAARDADRDTMLNALSMYCDYVTHNNANPSFIKGVQSALDHLLKVTK